MMNKVFRANSGTKQIVIAMDTDTCCDDVVLKISPVVCPNPPKRKYKRTLCGGVEMVEEKREPLLTLEYTMFDRAFNGDLQFLLDSSFADLPCGRYNAVVYACDCPVYKFQIDKKDKYTTTRIEAKGSNNCCEGRYGC